jgi:hypothetical protein
MSVLEFDRPRAVRIFRELANRWHHREAPFNTERFIPPEIRFHPDTIDKGTREHALFLFFAAWLNRNGKTANKLLAQAKDVADNQPWIIDPSHPDSHSRARFDLLLDIIPFANHEKYHSRVDWWFQDAMGKLRDRYDSDPRKLFLGTELSGDWKADRTKILSKLTDFHGVGGKIAQLTLGWFQEAEWVDDQDQWEKIRRIPAIAADMWVMRLMRQLNIVTSYQTDIATAISPEISNFVCEVCYEEGISHTDLIQALWHTGAIVCGRMRPKTIGQGSRFFCYSSCPVAKQCVGIVPANYISMEKIAKRPQKNGKQRTTTRLASMRWDEIIEHAQTLDDLWD